jgi:hypothetical protein
MYAPPFLFFGFGQDPFPLCLVAHQWKKTKEKNHITIISLAQEIFPVCSDVDLMC